MKCISCGKSISNDVQVCPHCGKPQSGGDFDDFSGGDFGGGEGFDGEPSPVAAVRRNRSSGRMLPVLLLIAGVLVIGAVAFFLLRGGKKVSSLPPFLAPTGHSERIDEGRGILLNELLVIPGEKTKQADMDKLLEPLDGAVVAYWPAMNQYQVRFNTSTRQELDEKKQSLEQERRIERVDYNLLLTVSRPAEAGMTAEIPAGSGGKTGILGDWASPKTGKATMLYLPSLTYADEAALQGIPNGVEPVSPASWDETVGKLAEGRTLFVANAFYYDRQDDGSLYVTTTSAALRYQLGSLLESGAEWIAVPLCGPRQNNDELLDREAELMNLTLTALEGKTPNFVIFKGQQEEKDWLTSVLKASEKASAHTLTAAPCGTGELSILNASGADVPVYETAASLQAADCCAPGAEAETAAIMAMVSAESVYGGKADLPADQILANLKTGATALAADAEGTVRPVFRTGEGLAAAAMPDGCELLTLRVEDGITGLPIADADVKADGAAGAKKADSEGKVRLLTAGGRGSVSVSANGYQALNNQQVTAEAGKLTLLPENQAEATGTIRGTVTDDNPAPDGLRVTLRDPESGAVRMDMQSGYNISLPMYPGTYNLTVTAHDRTPVTVYGVEVKAGETVEIPGVVFSVPSDLPGGIYGTIKDAKTGDVLEGVSVDIFEGVNAPDTGTPVAHATTGADGRYQTPLPGGQYTAYLSKEGYQSTHITVQSVGEEGDKEFNYIITPVMPEGEIRIVLTWGANPRDLDSHLYNLNQKIHIYYPTDSKVVKRNGVVVAELDVDDTDGDGPETTTIHEQLPGKYIFCIHKYAGVGEMRNSGAEVRVWIGGQDTPMVFNVPDEDGIYWEVFTVENGVITPVNRMITYNDWRDLESNRFEYN